MAADMSMNQVIHAAVRRDLQRMEAGLRSMSDGDRDRADVIGRTWDHFRFELTHHHEGEDELVWPFLRSVGVDQALLDQMESEHQDLARALADGGVAIDAVRASGSAADATKAADTLAAAYAVVDRHLNHEEDDVEPLLGEHAESDGWKAVEKKLRGGLNPVQAGWFFAWVQDGASERELTYLRSTIPGPVLFIFGRVLGRGYGRIAAAWS